jgi:NAD(P)-dependent dehydrogenase (short-subunit alcohol dehydrogenase family)
MEATMRFQDQVALVTGANSGIGRATAERLVRGGAKVGVLGRSEDEIEATAKEFSGDGTAAMPLVADVTDADAMKRAIDALAERWGRLDLVVANAGINGVWAPIDDLEPDEWDETMAVNLRGTYLTLHHAVPHLKRGGGGAVVIVSSVQGTRTFSTPGSTAYACTKAAQVTLAKKMAIELASDRIRVNVVCPGATDTDIEEKTERRNVDEIEIEPSDETNPLLGGRPMTAGEVAEAIAFLLSPEAAAISGTELWVDAATTLVRC